MLNKSTHFIFDGEKVTISPDLRPIVNFLQEIEAEVETILGFDKKLEAIRKQCTEIVNFTALLLEKIKNNNISLAGLSLPKNPSTLNDKLMITRPIRSEMIVLFAYLETLLCLYIAYDNKNSDEKFLIHQAMNQDVVKYFLENFCLNKENEWCQKQPERLKHITVDDLRKLRNSLAHFFSVGQGLGISYAVYDIASRQLEQDTHFQAKFISPEDLYEIIRGVAKSMIKKWSEDCKIDLLKKTGEFTAKILAVKDAVEKHGAVIMKMKQGNT